MLTQEQVLSAVKGGREYQALDGRDFGRLIEFFPADQWEAFGFKIKEGVTPDSPKPWTEEAIISQLRDDVEFGLEKASNQRGISASCMYEVVKMWMWILEDDLQHDDNYGSYGLPYFNAVAAKYGTPVTVTP